MNPRKQITSHDIANEILETTMLMSLLGGNGDDNRIGRMAKAKMRFRTSGSVEEGNLTYAYKYPDGTKGEYALIHGTFSTRTGFQAAAFEKTLTTLDGQAHSSVKLVFPGTAMRNQFDDLNAFDTFWTKRIGSQLHNAKQWIETEVLPRMDSKKPIEISGHCLGTQNALWAKAFLEQEHHQNVTGVALIEPTAPGLVVRDIMNEIKQIHGTTSRNAIGDLYRNVYTVFVDPPTIVCPFGQGSLWDTVAVGERSFTAHLPPTKLYEELGKVMKAPLTFRREWIDKEPDVVKELADKRRKKLEELKRTDPGAALDTPEKPLATLDLQTRAFFKTALGVEMEQQFFKNHYLLALATQLLPEKPTPENPTPRATPPEEFITEGPMPNTAAMIARKPPNLGNIDQYLWRLLTAIVVDHGRGIADLVTKPCLRGGRTGVPSILAPDPIWSTSQIQTEDDSREGNYPRKFFIGMGNSNLQQALRDVTALITRLEKDSPPRQHLEQDRALVMQALGMESLSPLPLDQPGHSVNEVQARAVVKTLPALRSDLEDCARQVSTENTACHSAIHILDEANKNLRRAYTIKPEHDIIRYR